MPASDPRRGFKAASRRKFRGHPSLIFAAAGEFVEVQADAAAAEAALDVEGVETVGGGLALDGERRGGAGD